MRENEHKPVILAVDDTPENLDVVKGILTPEFTVKAAINGNMALKIAEAQSPDLILLDIMMPEMDGYEVCRRLKANPNTANIPVIFLTAMDQDTDEAEGFELGAADYIQKPVNALILQSRTRTHVQLKKKRDDLQYAYAIINRQKERMQDELNVGHDIQMSMLLRDYPLFPGYDEFSVHATLEPAREVGGDFYDLFFVNPDEMCLIVADVSGKGVPSALFMAVSTTLFRAHAADDGSPASIMTRVNNELSRNNPSSMFVTVFLAILNIKTGELRYCNAGHNPPLLKEHSGSVTVLRQIHGPIAGALPQIAYKEDRLTLKKGTTLLAFTDGVTEAMNVDEQLYSDDRLERWFAATAGNDAEDWVNELIASVKAFTAGAEQSDDITILALTYDAEPEEKWHELYSIKVPNKLEAIDEVIAGVEAFAADKTVPDGIMQKLCIAFDELLNNIISYGYQDDDVHEITVVIDYTVDELVVTITDDGIPFNPLTGEDPDVSLTVDEREVGGLGIYLVKEMMDDMSYKRKASQNVVQIVKKITTVS
jgi:sigma-B regulation protein RsbU (phosphoserine phosphatase)